jgi:hypothetical protein
MKLLGVLSLLAICQSAAFHFGQMEQKRHVMQLKASSSEGDSRRDFFSKSGATALSIASASGLGFGVMAPPANALGGISKVTDRLKA